MHFLASRPSLYGNSMIKIANINHYTVVKRPHDNNATQLIMTLIELVIEKEGRQNECRLNRTQHRKGSF